MLVKIPRKFLAAGKRAESSAARSVWIASSLLALLRGLVAESGSKLHALQTLRAVGGGFAQRRGLSVAAIQHGPNLLRRGDQLVRLGVGDLFAALRFDGADEGREGVAAAPS